MHSERCALIVVGRAGRIACSGHAVAERAVILRQIVAEEFSPETLELRNFCAQSYFLTPAPKEKA
ncbi:hypothetical protein HOR51_gp13 [Ralstonia phage phiAp1]|uniref:Uncharacterized protein n=1 Tax=Ralstonia phage phiAp1 TaxID=2783867 RepID=A0A1L7DS57_9CAUD|nr:hypothetical protein HOR51_gp13 [Ralstonia phage phiAp1]APU03154.1 hypothetical protein phiAp1_13 [Ralstonia phage phiAp1]